MSTTFTELITLEKVSCGNCGGTYALNAIFLAEKRKESGGWHCPYCNQNRGYWESEADQLRKQLEAAQVSARHAKCKEMEERIKREEIEQKLEKVVKRTIKNGVCPCCKRSFCNLRRHMAAKHKDYKP